MAPRLSAIEHDPDVVANIRLNDTLDSMGSDIQAELNERSKMLHGIDSDRLAGRVSLIFLFLQRNDSFWHKSYLIILQAPDEQKQKRKYTKRKNIDVKPSVESLKSSKSNKVVLISLWIK